MMDLLCCPYPAAAAAAAAKSVVSASPHRFQETSIFLSRRCRSIALGFSVRSRAAEESGMQPDSEIQTAPDVPLSAGLDTSSSSLLTYSNIRKVLVGEDVVTVDHYGRLGVRRGASFEEVAKAFQDKCEGILQQGLDEDSTRNQLRTFKDSFEVLTSEEQRRLYDWSLLRAENRGRVYTWPFEADITQMSSAPAPPRAPEDEEGTRNVGYFFLGWFILSCVLSLVLR